MVENIFNKANTLNRKVKRLILICIDSLVILFALHFSLYLRLENVGFIYNLDIWVLSLFIIFFSIIFYNLSGLYLNITKFISDKIVKKIVITSFFSSLLIPTSSYVLDIPTPRSIPLIYFLIIFFCKSYVRFSIRFLYNNYLSIERENVVIYGCKQEEIQLCDLLNSNYQYKPIAFLDDNKEMIGNRINGINVIEFQKNFDFLKKENVKIIFVSDKNFPKFKEKVIHELKSYPIEIKKIPNLQNLLKNSSSLQNLANISINELLGREAIVPMQKLMNANITKKVIFVSGAGGSIGGELCKQIIELKPKKLILFENSEYALYQILQDLNELILVNEYKVTVVPILGFVQDKIHLLKIFKNHKINTLFHAAAYKHVSLVEVNPFEAIKNNIFGTQIIAKCAISMNINNFTLISTDKAVRPTSIMGSTKRIAELICQSYAKNKSKTIFSIVRFGNVLESSGSVIPLFKKQIAKGGPVTVTDKDVVRYFMTKSESAQLVIQASALAKGGEVFLLDMGNPIKIYDLAKQMIMLDGKTPYFGNKLKKNLSNNMIKIEIIGLNKGEKLFEEMFIGKNSKRTLHPRIFCALEEKVKKKDLGIMFKSLKNIVEIESKNKLEIFLKKTPLNYQD